MTIRWRNIAGIFLLVIATVLLIKNYADIRAFLMEMEYMGRGRVEDRTRGMIAFSFVLLGYLAAVRIFVSNNSNDKK